MFTRGATASESLLAAGSSPAPSTQPDRRAARQRRAPLSIVLSLQASWDHSLRTPAAKLLPCLVELHIEQGPLLEREGIPIVSLQHRARRVRFTITASVVRGSAPDADRKMHSVPQRAHSVHRKHAWPRKRSTCRYRRHLRVHRSGQQRSQRVVLQLDIRDTDPDRRKRSCRHPPRLRKSCANAVGHDHRGPDQRRRPRAIIPHTITLGRYMCGTRNSA